MLTRLNKKYDIDKIITQVNELNFGKNLQLNETDGNLFSGEYRIKSEFLNTPLGDVLEDMGDIGEARLLKLVGGETYTAHTDPDDRYHLAITTNPYCYLLDLSNNNIFHVPVDGYMWNMDTSVLHIAANFGSKHRIHLNIRHRLPKFTSPGYHIIWEGVDDPDWKQQLHVDVLGYLNNRIKDSTVTGLEKMSDREILINCEPFVLEHINNVISLKGFQMTVIHV